MVIASQVIEAGFASGQVEPQEFVILIEPFESRVEQEGQEGQDIESGKK